MGANNQDYRRFFAYEGLILRCRSERYHITPLSSLDHAPRWLMQYDLGICRPRRGRLKAFAFFASAANSRTTTNATKIPEESTIPTTGHPTPPVSKCLSVNHWRRFSNDRRTVSKQCKADTVFSTTCHLFSTQFFLTIKKRRSFSTDRLWWLLCRTLFIRTYCKVERNTNKFLWSFFNVSTDVKNLS